MSSSSHFFQTFGAPTPVDPAPTKEELSDLSPEILGSKGLGLVKMAAAGIPVPMGFILPTTWTSDVASRMWAKRDYQLVSDGIKYLERRSGCGFGDPRRSMLVSVRSGAAVSMPGMMDTVLNLGMTKSISKSVNLRSSGFGTDLYTRFVTQYEEVVGTAPPQDPYEQLTNTIKAVIASAQSDRAIAFRKQQGLERDLPTAVIVQAMAFGNRDKNSGTGVAFSRNPIDGTKGLYGDFLTRAQGEDVVGGTQITEPLNVIFQRWPEIGTELLEVADQLELLYQDMVDIEFTIDRKKLWILQARPGMRSPRATLQIAVDLANDPNFEITRAEAVKRSNAILESGEIQELIISTNEALESENGDSNGLESKIVGEGLAASPGVGRGILTTSIQEAIDLSAVGEDVVLVRHETSPHDIAGMAAAKAIVTARGGLVSHAAIVAREWKLPAVVGVDDWTIESDRIVSKSTNKEILSGTEITVDGSAGVIYKGYLNSKPTSFVCVSILRGWKTALFSQQQGSTNDSETEQSDISSMSDSDDCGTDIDIANQNGPSLEQESQKLNESNSTQAEVNKSDDSKESGGYDHAIAVTTTAQGVSLNVAYETFSDFELSVLRTIALKGSTDVDTLDYVLCENPLSQRASAVSAESIIEAALEKLLDESFIETADTNLRPTALGKSVIAETYLKEAAVAQTRVVPAYEQFQPLDIVFKEMMVLWQTREVHSERVLNDHTDLEYDRRVIRRIRMEVHPPALEVVAVAATALTRIDRYRYRLSRALIQAETGNDVMVASPLFDSYHTVWFELHEELLRLTNQKRAK